MKKAPNASRIYREVRELVWPRRSVFIAGLLLVFINRAAGLVLPGSVKYFIDDVVGSRRQDLLFWLVATVGAAVLIQSISSFALLRLLETSAHRLVAEMRIRVQSRLARLPVRYYDANKSGALVARVMWDVEGLRYLVSTGLVELVGGVFTAAIAFGMLVRINAALTLAAVGGVLVFGLVLQKGLRSMRPVVGQRREIYAEVSGRLTEALSGVRVVKGFHAEAREAAVFKTGAIRLFDNACRNILSLSLTTLASTLFMGVVGAIVMLVGGRLMIRETISLGDFFQFTVLLGFMVAPVQQIRGVGPQLVEALAGLDRTREILAEVPEDEDAARNVALGRVEGHVRFEDVTFEYNAGKPVLRGLTFDTQPGTVTALVGSSGAGKSTLIGLVVAFAKAKTGRVLVDGVDLSTVTLDSYRSQLGVVLQDSFLFDGSIRENIRFGRPDATDSDVVAAARAARVDEFTARFDLGLDTIVGERGIKLSGGQRQRVAIARAILADPRILILDEATSSLDSESESLIQEALAALMRGRTTFVIAHRLSTIRRADQILVLEGGLIVERGTHDELLTHRGRYFALHTRQSGVEARNQSLTTLS